MGKKFLRGINVSLLLLIIISTFSSCANEMNVFEGDNNNKQINFSVSVPQWKNTDSLATTKTSRATPITDNSFGTDKSFNLIADQNDGAGNYSTLIDNQAVSYTNNIWKTTNDYYWPGITNKTVNFYAYYPTSISGNISHTAGSSPTLSYTVPDNVSDQIDIMTATNNNVNGNTNSSTLLTFNHIFAAIQFNIGSSGMPNGTITGIALNNILCKGTYNFNGTWTQDATTKKSFLQTVSSSTTAGTTITSGSTTFMMMPQTLRNDASITVTYSNGGTLTQSIAGTWTAGNIYTYNISKTIPVANFDYTGNVQTYTTPLDGTYKIECWGASGGGFIGDSQWGSNGGKGGYSCGQLKLRSGNILYIFVGGQGQLVAKSTDSFKIGGGGYNGGGNGTGNSVASGYGGGGMSHISTKNNLSINGSWSPDGTLIVAGGGGGSDDTAETFYTDKYNSGEFKGGLNDGTGGYGGGSTAGEPYNGGTLMSGYAATQTNGYKQGVGESNTRSEGDSAGAGGGWYGGKVLQGSTGCNAGAGGGSGYIGNGVVGITIAGNQSFLSPSGLAETGHTGNGYARITFVSAN